MRISSVSLRTIVSLIAVALLAIAVFVSVSRLTPAHGAGEKFTDTILSGRTSTPNINPVQGDLDCDDDADLVDFTALMQFGAGLYDGVTDEAGCLDIGELETHNSNLPWGDVNCDGGVTMIDALYLIAYEASIILAPVGQGCFPIGAAMT